MLRKTVIQIIRISCLSALMLQTLGVAQANSLSEESHPDVWINCNAPSDYLSPFDEGSEGRLRNEDSECALVADINAKYDAGILNTTPKKALEFVKNGMQGAGCYAPKVGTKPSKRCMSILAELNDVITKGNLSASSIRVGPEQPEQFDWEACRKLSGDLQRPGGGAFIGISWVHPDDGFLGGHALQVKRIWCFRAPYTKGVAIAVVVDPNYPDREEVLGIDLEGGLVVSSDVDSLNNYTVAAGAYSFFVKR